jgi:hypothetical protein
VSSQVNLGGPPGAAGGDGGICNSWQRPCLPFRAAGLCCRRPSSLAVYEK